MKLKNYFILLTVLVISACSGYEKLLKSSDYELKYKKAMEYYEKEKYTKANTLLEQLIPIMRGTKQADTINFYYAMTNYKMGDYILAGHHFKNFSNTFGNSPFLEESEFLNAYCYYLLSPRPSLDQEYTYLAIQALRLFMIRYPNSERVSKSKELITELEEKLVEKSYISAKLYFDLGKYKSSIIALNNSLLEYPETDYREEMMFLILKSRFLLADNSVVAKQKERFQDTLDEYYSFITEFPESSFIAEATDIYKKTSKYLNITE